MKNWFKSWIVRMLVLMMAAPAAIAQDRVPFRQEELDQMLAPIALYPDPLLSQVLMASTYPLEVVQASRWSRANPGLKGQDAVRASEQMDWDPSVKSLTAFPQVLVMMDDKLEWTERLGEAFLAQPEDVMDSVQALRRRADAAGNLLSSEQMRVSRRGQIIAIEPPGPEVVYVPYYNPTVVYGTWWYPAYPPVYWAAPPAYYVIPAHRPGFYWSSGVVISAGFFFGHTDWQRRRVTVVHNHVTNVTVNRTTVINPPASRARATWQHDPVHRRGAPFRNAEARQRYEQIRAAAPATPRAAASATSADDRQRRVDERRNAAQDRSSSQRVERRENDKRIERRAPEPARAAPSINGNRSSVNSDGERAKPPVRQETQRNQPERQAQRPSPQSSEPRTERQAQRPSPKSVEMRTERREAPKPPPRAAEPPRPAVAAPQPQRAPQSAPPRAENRGNGNGNGNGNHGTAKQHNPGNSNAQRQQASPRSNGDHQKGKSDRGGKRRDD